MVDFTEDQVEDIKDGFDLYDRTGEGKLFYNQVGDLIRGLGFKPTNKDVAGVLGNPKKEEMNTKTCSFDEFLGYVKSIAETQQEGTFEDFVEGLRVFDKEGNGTVMGAEIRHVLATLGEKLTVEEVEIIFEGAEDANGQIHYENFIKQLMTEKE
jgi:myosin light chain 6